MAVSRRLGDEIHLWLLNDDLRPIPARQIFLVECPIRSIELSHGGKLSEERSKMKTYLYELGKQTATETLVDRL